MTFVERDHDRAHFPLRGKRVFVAGHRGLVGSALMRRLRTEGCTILTASHRELDLTRQMQTERWMRAERPDAIFIAAARVGGIAANARYPVEFLYENMMIGGNIMHAAHETGVQKLLWLGSSCIYPRNAPQPIREEMLLSGTLEATNEAYAIAKIAGMKLAQFYNKQYGDCFISAMPTNLYGPNDNFDPETSHVLPALMRRIHEAKVNGSPSVTLWGTGTPLREFLHVDDLADACVHLMKNYSGSEHINIGAGQEISIRDLASLIAEIIGYQGHFAYDTSKPDGTPRKRLDTSRMEAMGWRARIDLRGGIGDLYIRWLANTETREIAAVA
ncbi:GDP-fucose synthetase [Paramesorhizobium deserti]|uniref:GDP-L-fucose synthase n=1 Tax=Paramesorhizobium deserti TaxID=1494590 RepID=A0A135HZY3_9HYPH|nr:GDP-L-fucose synthase [Paramesorhizobium deserti]KXF78718.1 GDP-fucose synthetase [Paramesorhizobium deserti]